MIAFALLKNQCYTAAVMSRQEKQLYRYCKELTAGIFRKEVTIEES
jgi:hypothetical protein